MASEREAFLRRVREAVAEGNRAGGAAELPRRGGVGYQGAGEDPVARFCEGIKAAVGHAYLVADADAALARVLELVEAASPRRVLLGRGPALDTLPLGRALRARGIDVTAVDRLDPDSARDPLFAADLGISGAEYLIAETGSVVVAASPEEPRSLSLLPPVHIVVAERSQILPDLFDLFSAYEGGRLPSCLAIITGPSKTGDIELRLVTGVHGPGELHVVLVTG